TIDAHEIGTPSIVKFSRDGARVAATGKRGAAMWDLQTSAAMYEVASDNLRGAALSRDLDAILNYVDYRVELVTASATESLALVNHQPVFDVASSGDGSKIAAVNMATVRVWKLDGSRGRSLHGHEAEVRRVAFLRHHDAIVSAGEDGAIWIWDAATARGRLLGRHDGPIFDIAVSPDERQIATASLD